MAPRNFSEDGAFGAHNGAIDTALPNNGMSDSNFGSMSMLGSGSSGFGGFGVPGMTPSGGDSGGWGGGGLASPPSGGNDSIGGVGGSSYGGGGWGGGGMTPPPGASRADEGSGFMSGFSSFADGGAIDEDTGDAGGGMDNGLGRSIQEALGSVGAALAYGRKLHGIGEGGGEQQTADRMPAQPGNPYGQQREQPVPGPLPPTNNPFGKRADNMPMVPGSQSESGVPREQPTPGPLPPTDNPFGKRADAGEAIDTDDEEAA